MTSPKTTTMLLHGLGFAEGLRWHDSQLWFADLMTRRVCSVDLAGRKTIRGFVMGQPSGLGFLPDGTPLVVSMTERMVFKISNGFVSPYADAGKLVSSWCNDMTVDRKGRAYVGPTGVSGRLDDSSGDISAGASPTGLVVIDPDGSTRIEGNGLITPNGMAFTEDGSRLIVAESFKHRISVFDVDANGALYNRRIFADLGTTTPDGLCVDRNGDVWVACLEAGEFRLIRDGGEVLDKITVDGWAITCALGGPQLRTLCCAVARTNLEQLAKGDSEAWIVTAEVETPGFD